MKVVQQQEVCLKQEGQSKVVRSQRRVKHHPVSSERERALKRWNALEKTLEESLAAGRGDIYTRLTPTEMRWEVGGLHRVQGLNRPCQPFLATASPKECRRPSSQRNAAAFRERKQESECGNAELT